MKHKYTERPHPAGLGGVRRLFKFPNGYGANVIQFKYSYGGDRGLWELAVLKGNELCFDTPIADDVVGYLSWDAVEKLVDDIASLPEVTQ